MKLQLSAVDCDKTPTQDDTRDTKELIRVIYLDHGLIQDDTKSMD